MDAELCSGVRRILVNAVFGSLRRRCGVAGKKAKARAFPGAVVFGPEAGRWAQRVGFDPAAVDGSPGSDRTAPSIPKKLCANDGGFSLHARVRVDACARRRLEQLCRYAARGPIAQGRLSRTGTTWSR